MVVIDPTFPSAIGSAGGATGVDTTSDDYRESRPIQSGDVQDLPPVHGGNENEAAIIYYISIADFGNVINECQNYKNRIMDLWNKVESAWSAAVNFDPNNANQQVDFNAQYPAPTDVFRDYKTARDGAESTQAQIDSWQSRLENYNSSTAQNTSKGFPTPGTTEQNTVRQDTQFETDVRAEYDRLNTPSTTVINGGKVGISGQPQPMGGGYGGRQTPQGPSIQEMVSVIKGKLTEQKNSQLSTESAKGGQLGSFGISIEGKTDAEIQRLVDAAPDPNPEHQLHNLFPKGCDGDGFLTAEEHGSLKELIQRKLNEIDSVLQAAIKNVGTVGDVFGMAIKLWG